MTLNDRSVPLRPWYWPSKQVKWQVTLLFPWFIPLITYLLLGPRYVQHWPTFVGATLLNLALGISCQYALDLLTQRIISLYPSLGQTGWRLLWLLLSFMGITFGVVLGALFLYDHFHLFGYMLKPDSMARILVFNVVVNLMSVGAYESIYSLTKWRESMLEKEQLKKVNLQSQYESLKSQVNPHFLFNTLNTLSSLIADEPERAEEFVDEMAKVYRYLLQTNRQPGPGANDGPTDLTGSLTTLETELTFIHSYFHLLKTRYGTGIRLEVAIDATSQRRLVPPLTLQMLVENAVKHNVIHAGKPLTIELKTTPMGELMVRNNLQRRNTRVLSNQVGLSNIRAKYRLLAQRFGTGTPGAPANITIDETNDFFTVHLPLLDPLYV